jgi:hypothetical protein
MIITSFYMISLMMIDDKVYEIEYDTIFFFASRCQCNGPRPRQVANAVAPCRVS